MTGCGRGRVHSADGPAQPSDRNDFVAMQSQTLPLDRIVANLDFFALREDVVRYFAELVRAAGEINIVWNNPLIGAQYAFQLVQG